MSGTVRRIARLWLGAAWLAGLLLLMMPAAAAEGLRLAKDAAQGDPWTHVRVLLDREDADTPERALAALGDFTVPERYATLGIHRAASWIYLPLAVDADAGGEWVFNIDYPLLREVDIHLLRDGVVTASWQMGYARPFANRPLRTLTGAAPLVLHGGAVYALLVRVQTPAGSIVPLSLERMLNFQGHTIAGAFVIGLWAGMGCMLFMHVLFQWWVLRDGIYLSYLALLTVTGGFMLFAFGLAQLAFKDALHVHAGGGYLLLFANITAALIFMRRFAQEEPLTPWFDRLMLLGAAFGALSAVLTATRVMPLEIGTMVFKTLGPWPVLLGLAVAVPRWWHGNRDYLPIVVAWAGYAVGSVLFTSVTVGKVDASYGTIYAYQIATMFDMVLFNYVLGLRAARDREQSTRARAERDLMVSMAYTDALTGLVNRRGLQERLPPALAGATPQALLALYCIDLDGFKQANDRFGHETGDAILRETAQRLSRLVRETDVVARLGGDEFVVVASGFHTPAEAARLGQAIVSAIEPPVQVGENLVRVGATVGYAVAPMMTRDPHELMLLADSAMYVGKRAGKNRVEVALPAVRAGAVADPVAGFDVRPMPPALEGQRATTTLAAAPAPSAGLPTASASRG